MTASHTETRPIFLLARLCLVTALWLVAAADQAVAQGPLVLTPSGQPDSPEVAPLPQGTPDTATPAPPGDALPTSRKGIEVAPLDHASRDGIGTLTTTNGGLSSDIWQGTPRPLAERLLGALPRAIASASLRDLLRRLLLTQAAPPPAGATQPVPGSFLALRAERLTDLGDSAQSAALLARSGLLGESPRLARSAADAALINDDLTTVCALTADQVEGARDAFWDKTFVFCQLLASNTQAAELGLQLLAEQGLEDHTFFDLIMALRDQRALSLDGSVSLSPLHLALVRQTGSVIKADAVSMADPAVLRALAQQPQTANADQITSPAVRIEAAERAEAIGILTAAQLQQVYLDTAFGDGDLANPLSSAKTLAETPQTKPLARALLYRALTQQVGPAAIAEVAHQFLALARNAQAIGPASRAFAPHLADLPATPELLWFAGDAARVLWLAGRPDSAMPWLALAQQSRGPMAADLPLLASLARLSGAPDHLLTWTGDALETWLHNQPDPATAALALARLYGLLTARGTAIAFGNWQTIALAAPLAPGVTATPQILHHTLSAAATAGHVAETILLLAIGLGSTPLADSDPDFVAAGVAALAQVGLDGAARALAVEAAIEAGL